MKAWKIVVLCAACLAVGAAIGWFASKGALDKELAQAETEREMLLAGIDAATADVKASVEKLDALQKDMTKVTTSAEELAKAIASKTLGIDALLDKLVAYVQDARTKTRALGSKIDDMIKDYEALLSKLTELRKKTEAPK